MENKQAEFVQIWNEVNKDLWDRILDLKICYLAHIELYQIPVVRIIDNLLNAQERRMNGK